MIPAVALYPFSCNDQRSCGTGPSAAGEARIDAVSIWQNVVAHFEQLERHLLDEILVFANLIQIPAVILTGGVAWLVCRPIRRWVKLWVERVPEHHHLDWIVSHRSWVTDRLVPLITPVAWAIGLWISVAVAERAGWPHAVTQTAVNLLLAWLVIRLAAALVPYAALARLIAVLAWVVAALNIVHLLGPTLDLLDSVAVVVGGLRVSILTVVKGVLSLAMLLWAATVASNLFERRITRVSEITPRARVLLGKLIKATLVTLAVVLSLTSIGIDLTTFALFTGALGVGVGLGLAADCLEPVQRDRSAAGQVDQAGRRDRGGRHLWLGLLARRALCIGRDARRHGVSDSERGHHHPSGRQLVAQE